MLVAGILFKKDNRLPLIKYILIFRIVKKQEQLGGGRLILPTYIEIVILFAVWPTGRGLDRQTIGSQPGRFVIRTVV